MRYFIFKSPTYLEDESRYSLGNTVQKYEESLSKGKDFAKEYYSRIKGNYCVLKIRDNKFKGILTYRDYDNLNEKVRVFVALRIMPHQDTQYVRFYLAGTSESERDTISGKTSLDWDKYYSLVKAEMTPKQIVEGRKKDLTENERCFISNPIEVNHKIFELR